MKCLLTLGFFVLVLSPLACGQKGDFAGSASVSGKVEIDKIPIGFGSVQFYGAQMVHTALIQTDGSYKLDHLPEGPVTVCIRTRGELFADSRGEEEMRKHVFADPKMKEGLPEDMSMEELREMMVAKTGGGMKGKPGMPKGGMPTVRKGPRDEMSQVPLINGTPLAMAQGMPPEALKRMSEIHDRYGEFSKTPLNYTVLPGTQTYDIILK
jgi:hypothetical protein